MVTKKVNQSSTGCSEDYHDGSSLGPPSRKEAYEQVKLRFYEKYPELGRIEEFYEAMAHAYSCLRKDIRQYGKNPEKFDFASYEREEQHTWFQWYIEDKYEALLSDLADLESIDEDSFEVAS
jgi:hypothetical protein